MKPRQKSAAAPKSRIQSLVPVRLHHCQSPKTVSPGGEVDKVLVDLYRKIEEMRRKASTAKSTFQSSETDPGTGDTDLETLWEAKIDMISKEAREIAEKWAGEETQVERFHNDMREMLNRELRLVSKDRNLSVGLDRQKQVELLTAKPISYASEASKQISLLLHQNRLLEKTISELKSRFSLLPSNSRLISESTTPRNPTKSVRTETLGKKSKNDGKKSSDLERSRVSLDALQALSSTCQRYLNIERPFVRAVTDTSVTRAYKSLQSSLEQTQRCIELNGKHRGDAVFSYKQKGENRPNSYPGSDLEDDRQKVRNKLKLYRESENRTEPGSKNEPEFLSLIVPVISQFTSDMCIKLQYMETALISAEEKVDFLQAKLTAFRSKPKKQYEKLIDQNEKLENELKRIHEEVQSIQRLHNQEIQNIMERHVSDLENVRAQVETQGKRQIHDRENRLFSQMDMDRLQNEVEESRKLIKKKDQALKAAEVENFRKLDELRKENEEIALSKSDFLHRIEEISLEMAELQAEIQRVPVLQQEIVSLQRTNRSLTSRLSDEKVAIEQEIARIQAETLRIKEQKTDSDVRISRLHMAISDLEGTILRSAEQTSVPQSLQKTAEIKEAKSDFFELEKMRLEDVYGWVGREVNKYEKEIYELTLKIADLEEENSVLGSENSEYYKEKQDSNLDSLLQKCFPAETVQELDQVVKSLKEKWFQELDREQVFALEITSLRDENRQLREWAGMLAEDHPAPDENQPNLIEPEPIETANTIVKDLFQHLIEELLLENIATQQVIDQKTDGFRQLENRVFRSETPIIERKDSVIGDLEPPLSLMVPKHNAAKQDFERLEKSLRKTLGSIGKLQGFIVRMKEKQGELIEGLRLDQDYALLMLDLSTKISELKEKKSLFSRPAEVLAPDSPRSPASLLDSDSSGFGRMLSEASGNDFRADNVLSMSLNDSLFESALRNNPETVQNPMEKELVALREKATVLGQAEDMVKRLSPKSTDILETLKYLIAQNVVQSEGQQSPPGSSRLLEIEFSSDKKEAKTMQIAITSPSMETEKSRQMGNAEDIQMCRESIESGGAPTYYSHLKDAILKLISMIPNR